MSLPMAQTKAPNVDFCLIFPDILDALMKIKKLLEEARPIFSNYLHLC